MSALLPPRPTAETTGAPAPPAEPAAGQVQSIPLDLIDPNPHQPRREFDEDRLKELAQSIRADGVIQPVVVRQSGRRYGLIVGERRCRAARMAGLTEIAALIQDIPEDRLLEVTLIENIQREDLNPLEVAHALERMSSELRLSHEEIARRTGKDRATVTNLLRLLKLELDVQSMLADGQLTAGHARALVGIDPTEQRHIAKMAADRHWSVRHLEEFVRTRLEPSPAGPLAVPLDPNFGEALGRLREVLGTQVRLVERGKDKGRLEIEYYSQDDLMRIYDIIVGEAGTEFP